MKIKQIPTFSSEEEEREFWSNHDVTDFIDFSEAKQSLMPNLRPTLKTVSIRLPESLLESIRVLAHKRDVPYQSLIKLLLAEVVSGSYTHRGNSEIGMVDSTWLDRQAYCDLKSDQ